MKSKIINMRVIGEKSGEYFQPWKAKSLKGCALKNFAIIYAKKHHQAASIFQGGRWITFNENGGEMMIPASFPNPL